MQFETTTELETLSNEISEVILFHKMGLYQLRTGKSKTGLKLQLFLKNLEKILTR